MGETLTGKKHTCRGQWSGVQGEDPGSCSQATLSPTHRAGGDLRPWRTPSSLGTHSLLCSKASEEAKPQDAGLIGFSQSWWSLGHRCVILANEIQACWRGAGQKFLTGKQWAPDATIWMWHLEIVQPSCDHEERQHEGHAERTSEQAELELMGLPASGLMTNSKSPYCPSPSIHSGFC